MVVQGCGDRAQRVKVLYCQRLLVGLDTVDHLEVNDVPGSVLVVDGDDTGAVPGRHDDGNGQVAVPAQRVEPVEL